MAPGMTSYSGDGSGECTCFVSALRASEQLHQVFAGIETQPLDQVVITTRQAVNVVHQYSTCSLCADSSRFPFYALLLRQVTECYPALLQRGSSTRGETNTIKLQVGTFSINAPTETAMQAVVFSEVQRTIDVISELGDVLQPDGVKNARETWDEATSVLSALGEVEGPEAATVSKYKRQLANASDTTHRAGYNMPCSPASANQIKDGDYKVTDEFQMPAYDISAQYKQEVTNWISTYPQKKDKPISFKFTVKDAESKDWSDIGFKESNIDTSGRGFIFFRASYTENNQEVVKEVRQVKNSPALEVEVTMTGYGRFAVNPSPQWNPSELKSLNLRDDIPAELTKPYGAVTQVMLGYGVGLKIKLSTADSEEIHNYMKKASKTKGSVSFCGWNIGLGGSVDSNNTSTSTFDEVKTHDGGSLIEIPPNDNAYPTLLAAIGTKL
ncbi:hypothetical protein B7463_g11755, partial [Scytalidium lignicola]